MAVLEAFPLQEGAVISPVAAHEAEKELVYVRAVRTTALFVIVTLHVAFPLIYLYNSVGYGEWWTGTNFYIWGKIGSPMFTMVSGLLLLNPSKEQPISLFFKKRFTKVLFPFIAWTFLYLLWRLYFNHEMLKTRDIVVAFVQGPMYYHLWFIQMILGLYLATPILRVYVRHANQSNLTYFLGVWFVTVSILPIIKRFAGVEVGVDIVVTTQYVGFFILGYYLRNVTLEKRYVLPVLLTIILSVVFTQVITHQLTRSMDGTFDNFFVLNDSFNLVIAAICLFVFLKSLDYDLLFAKLPFLKFIIMTVSSCSLGIYFIHVMIIELLASGRLGFQLTGSSFNPLFAIPLTSAITMLASVGVVLLLKKMPYVQQIVP